MEPKPEYQTQRTFDPNEPTNDELYEIRAAIAVIRRETGHGKVIIEFRDGEISELYAQVNLRTKKKPPQPTL